MMFFLRESKDFQMEQTEITLNRALELQARRSPDKVFIYHQDGEYTYAETNDLVNRFAAYLQATGLKAKDKVCLMLPRVPELVIAFLAATRIGARPAPVNYLWSSSAIVDFVRRLSPQVFISHEKLLAKEIAGQFAATRDLLCIDTADSQEGWVKWNAALAVGPQGGKGSIQTGDVAYLNYTTGSSGQPKGALATHANIYWNTRSAVEALGLVEDDIHLCMFASFAHPHEIFSRALFTGASLVLQEKVNPKTIIRTINRYSVTCVMGLAPMYEAMASHCGAMQVDSLKIAESGGMFTRQRINESFRQVFGLPLLSVWGSTETSGIAIANPTDVCRMDGSIGRVCPHYQVKLVDEEGREVSEPGVVGEMYFKGPGVVSGYDEYPFGQDAEGWYASGDMAKMDDSGYYYYIERKSGMIKMAGLKIYPLQVELVLLEHPKITEVAVLGVADRRKGCVPKAFVVVQDGMSLDIDEIISFCKERIPPYMVPRQLEIMTSLPKIGSGKIDKKRLQGN